MAKVRTAEKHGSVGPSTFQRSRYGLIERQRSAAVDPKTLLQQNQRALLAAVSKQWRGLSEEERAGWKALAGTLAGQLGGLEAHNKVNATLVKCGLPVLRAAPPVPVFGPLTCAGLRVSDTPRVQLLQLSGLSGADWLVLRACRPMSPSIESVENRFRHLTAVAVPAAVPVDLDLTAAYVERFHPPRVGERVYMRVLAMKNGFLSTPLAVSALVVGGAV